MKTAVVGASQSGTVAPATIVGGTTPTGFTPAQLRAAYGLGTPGATAVSYPVTFNGIAGDGSGQTIAIVVAYDDPNAISDLHGFSQYFGLPDAPSFQVLNEYGQASPLPGTDPVGPNPQASGSWEEEASLDIEWSHAMAPKANLVLYEADTADADIYQAIQTAGANPAVTVVNMSFGGGEYPGETTDDAAYFTTPAAHHAGGGTGGVTFLAATGDGGAGVEWPSSSPDVVAVGGTGIALNPDSSYGVETAWSGGGGGVSTYESQPAYQAATVSAYSTANRTVPDVSIDANPNTGVSIYDSYDFGATTPWLGGGYRYGGTSLATPLWSGIVAVADQGRATAGLPSLNSLTGTLPRLYQLPATDFHDITSGSNGYSAAVGYDLATGRGTPVANTLIGDLAGSAAVAGRAFVDANGDGAYDGTDTPLAGQTVYLDLNNDGALDNGEPSTTTAANGTYAFADVAAGGTVRTVTPAGYVAVPTGTSAAVAYGTGQTANFAYFPTAYASSANGAQFTLKADATGTVDQVSLNGTAIDSIAASLLGSTPLSFTTTGTNAGLTVNGVNGNPVPPGGVTFAGAAGANDALSVVGTAAGNDAFVVGPTSVTFGSTTITTANVAAVSVNPGTGTATLGVTAGGAATVPGPAAGGGLLARRFASVSVASGATLAFATDAAHADRQIVVTSALTVAGTIDLGGNDMVVRNGSLSAVTALAKAGFANGRWNGVGGLDSSAAAADATHLTALGVAAPTAATFDGQAVSSTDALVKYTDYGDANLDGVVNAADYTRVDAGFVLARTGWANGDVNYDGVVDGSDYALVDNAFNRQAAPL